MEIEIVHYLNRLGLGKIDIFSEFVSWIPFLIALYSFLIIFLYFLDKKKGRLAASAIIIALIIHFIISELLLNNLLQNYLVMRDRPFVAYPDLIIPIGKQFLDSSFPSGHMASTVAVMSVLTWGYRKIWPFSVLFVLLMAFSRLHNGMHYPSDILAGSILGFLYAMLAIKIVKLSQNP